MVQLFLKHIRIFFVSSLIILFFLIHFPSIAAVNNPKNPAAITVPSGYKIETYAVNLSVPTTAIFDNNDLIIAESGDENTAKARVFRLKPDGSQQVIASVGLIPPVTGLLMVNGKLYVSHKTKISYIENGKLVDIVTDLPSNGDHENNKMALGPDGRIYVGQGTVTNSGVVGVDNFLFGWLQQHQNTHDIPCQDITLTGENFITTSPLTNPPSQVTTGAYHQYGVPSTPGEIIKGNPKCNGAILSFTTDGADVRVVAWGMRNPFGVQFDANGQLWTTFHGADVRGSRNIFNDPDYLIKVEPGAWYGWPEYFDNGKPASAMKAPTKEQPNFLWKIHPQLSLPFLTFEPHAATNGLAFSPGKSFGFADQAFVAEYGTYSILTSDINVALPGFKIVRVDIQHKQIYDFAYNNLPGPAYLNQARGFDRPSDVVFGPDQSLYMVDWGASTIGFAGLKYVPNSGTIWRIYSSHQTALRPHGPITVNSNGTYISEPQRKVQVKNHPTLYAMLSSQTIVLTAIGIVIAIGILLLITFLRRVNKK